MATYTDTLGYYKGNAAFGAHSSKRFGHMEVELDFEKIIAARSAASATALAAGDTMQVLQVPAGALLLAGGIDVIEAETTNTTGTFSVGCLGGSPMAANALAATVANNALGPTSTGLAAPVWFSAADTIDVLLNTAVGTNVRIRVWGLFYNGNCD